MATKAKAKAKAKSGQVPFIPTDEQRELVAMLAGSGVPQPAICRFVRWPEGISRNAGKPITDRTLREVFRAELDMGMEIANGRVAASLFQNAVKHNNVAAQIFWMKTRAGWKEPAQDVMLHKSWGELVQESYDRKPERPALTVVPGGKSGA